MSRSPQLRLEDIVEACEQVAIYVSGYDETRFTADAKTCDAVVRQFEIIGEAVKALPESLQSQEPLIPWRLLAGFRDVLAHSYFSVETSVVWDAAVHKAPELHAACLRLLRRSGTPDS
jgi:uncharacterized protein with HEPN domain